MAPNITASKKLTGKAVYEAVTAQVVEMLEHGTAPWVKPWDSLREMPRRINGDPYEGWNVFHLLWVQRDRGYESNLWLTRHKIEAKGGHVKPGEESTLVIFWHLRQVPDPEDPERHKTIPLLRFYEVFNLEQTAGLEGRLPRWYREIVAQRANRDPIDPIAAAQAITEHYLSNGGPTYRERGDQAWYDFGLDLVQVPARADFRSAEGYHATQFHELAHSTGHKSRLDRPRKPEEPTDTRLKVYGKEELVAEMTAAMLCGEAGILDMQVEQTAAYLRSWVRTIQGDPHMVITAAGAAQRAADYVLGRTSSESQPAPAAAGHEAGAATREAA